jgi:hypothetical protein
MNNIIIPGIEEMINQQIKTVRIINKKNTKDQTIPKIINIMIT